QYEAAAKFLEQALKAGPADAQVAYLLALAHKRQGRTVDARQALRQITPQDANVFLQLGLLSLQEKQLGQAEQEFARSWDMDSTCYETGYNLLLSRLALGQLDAGLALAPQVLKLAPTREEGHFLRALQGLCEVGRQPGAEYTLESPLHDLRDN